MKLTYPVCPPHLCRYEYLWEDGVRYKKATKLPAPEYVDALMNWAQGLLDNEEIFPSEMGASVCLYFGLDLGLWLCIWGRPGDWEGARSERGEEL